MTNLQNPSSTNHALKKLEYTLDRLATKVANSESGEITQALSEALSSFKEFYSNYSEIDFKPQFLKENDTTRSELYNSNLERIFNDLQRFYQEIKTLTQLEVNVFNYSQIVTTEIVKRANQLASIVLDLNILNNFTRGDVIVAGDDFKNMDFIDQGAENASTPAELLTNGSGIGLARAEAIDILRQPGVKLEVAALEPADSGVESESAVNSEPTAGNFQRFYEGNYYNFLGAARPEGGSFNLKYLADPKLIDKSVTLDPTDEADEYKPEVDAGFYVELGASEAQKKEARKRMVDGDPATFWECEYLYRTDKQLIEEIIDSAVIEEGAEQPDDSEDSEFVFDDPEAPRGASINIDLDQAERAAQQYDFEGRDLVVELIISLPKEENINFVSINPVLFGVNAFPIVEDISTADSSGVFLTVDGWRDIRYAKTITPEANEFLTDSQLAATLAPSRYDYTGQGIYPFPVRVANKVKIRIRVESPIPSPYERTYALLKKVVEVESTITTRTRRGLFR